MARGPKVSADVAEVLAGYPPRIRKRVLALRERIYATAACTEGVGAIEETLKWGEPAYLTSETGSGTTLRLGWHRKHPTRYALYVHCQTDLIERFRNGAPDSVEFEGNRAIVFEGERAVPQAFLTACITEALTYHRSKGAPGRRTRRS